MAAKNLRITLLVILTALVALLAVNEPIEASTTAIEPICPGTGITPRGPAFQPGGIILTAFDRSALWVYDIDRDRRYPLPETAPCGRNCRLSPDSRWITYYNRLTQAFNRMRLDGTQRQLVVESASDIEWWSGDRYFVWTPGHGAYILNSATGERQPIGVRGVSAVQPNGVWGLRLSVTPDGEGFTRFLTHLTFPSESLELGIDLAYYNAHGWSPDGRTLALVAPAPVENAETPGSLIQIVRPDDNPSTPITLVDLRNAYGTARVNGLSVGELSWSPDSTRIAFWVIPVTGADPTVDTGDAQIHVVDVNTGVVRAYCGFTTGEHTPNPPRLNWSPDGTHLAFSGNVPDDDFGYLLLALNTDTGTVIRLSDGIYPALGEANVFAWGLPPN